MASDKGSSLLYAVMLPLAVVLIALIAAFFMWQGYVSQPTQTTQTVQQPATQNNQTGGWNTFQINTYRNDGYHFALQYPDNFFDAGHEPSAGSGMCSYQNVPNGCPTINEVIGSIAGLPQTNGQRATINNTDYCHYQIGDAAAGHRYYTDYYWTVKDGTCSTVNIETSETSCDNYTPGSQDQQNCLAKNTARPNTLQQIINTLTFTK